MKNFKSRFEPLKTLKSNRHKVHNNRNLKSFFVFSFICSTFVSLVRLVVQKKLHVVACIFMLMCVIILPTSCDRNPYKQGKLLYENFCQNCHQENGEALLGLIPPLKNSDYLRDHQADLPCIVRHGLKGEIIVNNLPYDHEMPANPTFSEIEIANVINYINNAWGNNYGYVSYDEVKANLEECD